TNATGVFSLGGMHPDTPDYKSEIKRIADLGLKGIKLHPAYQQVHLDDIRYKRIIAYADELGLIVSVHGGVDICIPGDWSTPERARRVLDEVKPKKMIIAHMGGWQLWEDTKKFLCGQDVFLDTAFSYGNIEYRNSVPLSLRQKQLTEEKFMEIVRLHGADKILFGTDSPWDDLAEKLDLIQSLPLTSEEKIKILGKNGEKLLQL
ncbi:MAG: amidohydrolase family protein, partial [Clostridia bacterium]|nr:amidohydrolase family protein [Clostridia bacterium]